MKPTNVLSWLEATAERLPNKIAIANEDESLTFAELRARAQAAGTWYATHGVAPRQAVELFLEKSPLALAAMLGAAYAGAFYSVIDVRQTPSRVASITDTLQPALILTDAQYAEQAAELFADAPCTVARIEDVTAGEADPALLAAIRAQATETDPLYVSFTSGSTGAPKGVVAPHRSVLDFVTAFDETFGLGEDDIMGNQAPFDFDASVKDIYTSLRTGATVRIIPRSFFVNPTRLMDYLCECECTTLVWAVSAMCFVSIMNGFDYRVPTSVRRVLFSGEVMPPKQLRIWQRALPGATFVNLYGPTEVTCNCSYFVVDREYDKSEVIPAGRAFPNERIFLVDEEGREVTEPGVAGEVLVSGTTLCLGYLGNPEKTAEVFVQNPVQGRWQERAYRTGDLGHYDEAGNLMYEGRKDNQIKHLGQRIELGDIEATCNGVDGVGQSACVYDARRKKIRLFYAGTADHDFVAEELRRLLPQYMVPNAIRQLESMPLNKNGKIDRKQLAETR